MKGRFPPLSIQISNENTSMKNVAKNTNTSSNTNANANKCKPMCDTFDYAFSKSGANGQYVLCRNEKKGTKKSIMKKTKEVIEEWKRNIENLKILLDNEDTSNVKEFFVLPEDIEICGKNTRSNIESYVVQYKQKHIAGKTLQEFFKNPPHDLKHSDILYIFMQLSFVLSWLHNKTDRKGTLIHNDLHIGNVLVEELPVQEVNLLDKSNKGKETLLEKTLNALSIFARNPQKQFDLEDLSMKNIITFRKELGEKLVLFSSAFNAWNLTTKYKISIIDWEEFQQPFLTSNKKCAEHMNETNVACAENLLMTALTQNKQLTNTFV